MTSPRVHAVPTYRTVLWGQLQSIGFAIRTQGLILFAALVVVAVLLLCHADDVFWSYLPLNLWPIILLGLFLPFGVWRSEEPSRRTYHWVMPVSHGAHTILKVMAGWIWLMIGIALYVLFHAGLAAIALHMGGTLSPQKSAMLWQWGSLLVGPSIAYLLLSIAVVGSDHPWWWIGGSIIVYVIGLIFFAAIRNIGGLKALVAIIDGPYGFMTAIRGTSTGRSTHFYITGDGDEGSISLSEFSPHGDAHTMLLAALLWIVICVVGISLVSYGRSYERRWWTSRL